MTRRSVSSPARANFRTAQRRHQVACLLRQAGLPTGQQLDLATQVGFALAVLGIEPLRLGARGFQCRLQRRYQLRQLLFAAPAGQQLGGQVTQRNPDQQRRADQAHFQSGDHVAFCVTRQRLA
jgi:hypothetical protein